MATEPGERAPFYMPDPELFGHSDAYRMYTTYAAELEQAGLADRFPPDSQLRHVVIELLAERYPVGVVEEELGLIDDAVAEARGILERRRR